MTIIMKFIIIIIIILFRISYCGLSFFQMLLPSFYLSLHIFLILSLFCRSWDL